MAEYNQTVPEHQLSDNDIGGCNWMLSQDQQGQNDLPMKMWDEIGKNYTV